MALYALGDTHLSLGTEKPMDVFGGAWTGYVEKLRQGMSVLREEDTRLFQKVGTAMRNLSVLLTMSMESAVETADSMKARGYGTTRRTTFHLFRRWSSIRP